MTQWGKWNFTHGAGLLGADFLGTCMLLWSESPTGLPALGTPAWASCCGSTATLAKVTFWSCDVAQDPEVSWRGDINRRGSAAAIFTGTALFALPPCLPPPFLIVSPSQLTCVTGQRAELRPAAGQALTAGVPSAQPKHAGMLACPAPVTCSSLPTSTAAQVLCAVTGSLRGGWPSLVSGAGFVP